MMIKLVLMVFVPLFHTVKLAVTSGCSLILTSYSPRYFGVSFLFFGKVMLALSTSLLVCCLMRAATSAVLTLPKICISFSSPAVESESCPLSTGAACLLSASFLIVASAVASCSASVLIAWRAASSASRRAYKAQTHTERHTHKDVHT